MADSITDAMNIDLGKLGDGGRDRRPGMRQFMGSQELNTTG